MKHGAMGNVEEMLQCTSKGSEEEDCKLVNMERYPLSVSYSRTSYSPNPIARNKCWQLTFIETTQVLDLNISNIANQCLKYTLNVNISN